MKKLFVVLALLFSMPAWAIDSRDVGAAGFDKLSATDQAKIVAQVEGMARQANSVDTPEKVEAWVNVGTNIGKGLVGAARELGVAANEFAATPLGMLTMALIVWHFLGGMVVHVIGGFTIWIVGFAFTYVLMRRQTRKIEFDLDEKNKQVAKRVIVERLDGEQAVLYWFANLVVLLIGLAVLVTF